MEVHQALPLIHHSDMVHGQRHHRTATGEHSNTGNTTRTQASNSSLSDSMTQGSLVRALESLSTAEILADTTTITVVAVEPKYFIMKSDNKTDIETSATRGIWCCGQRTNKRLSKKYNNTRGPVFLIFSVNKRSNTVLIIFSRSLANTL